MTCYMRKKWKLQNFQFSHIWGWSRKLGTLLIREMYDMLHEEKNENYEVFSLAMFGVGYTTVKEGNNSLHNSC